MRDEDADRLTRRVLTLGSWTPEATAELFNTMLRLVELRAAELAVDELVETWDTGFRPPIARMIAMYREKLAGFSASRVQGTRGGCDGSGLIPGTDAPCPRCNPFVAQIYADPVKWRLYTTEGVPLTSLVDGVKLNAKGDYVYDVAPPPPRCQPEVFRDPGSAVVSPGRGYDIGMAAYVQDCKELGIPVDVDKFHGLMKGLLGKPEPETTVKFGTALKPRDPSEPERHEDF